MPIENHLQLTTHLTLNYIGSLHPKCNAYAQTKVAETDTLVQYQLKEDGTLLLSTNITQVDSKVILINLVFGSPKKLDSVLIDWNANDIVDHDLKFPIDELNLSNDLIQAFNNKVKGLATNDAALKQLFDQPIEQQEKPHTKTPNPDTNDADKLDRYGGLSKFDDSTEGRFQRPNDMPDFDDELEIRGSGNRGFGGSAGRFPSIGDRDLNPPGLPRHPEMRPFIDPLSSGGEGGMHPTPEHPIFGGRYQGGNSSRAGVPPGARYDDPYGEDNLESLGFGLPGNLRGPGGPGGPGHHGAGPGSGGSPGWL